MYEPFFGFHRRPFSTAPDPGCFFAGESVREVLSELTTCVERGQGIALLTAPAGMGKSLLCQRLISNLKAQFATIYLGNANFPTRRSLLQAILLELGDEYSRSDEAELRHTLQKRLHGLRRQHEALLLVVDEAHLFESDLLEEIRTLADIAAEGQPLVRIVLSGQLEPEERLTDRRFDALNQRLGTHAYLEPLTQSESAEYLHHRIEQAGGDAENVFTEDGFSIIVRASGGVPRCLNQLADHSLLLAFAADEKPVKEKTVRDARDDLKQLPLHWNDVSDSVSSSTFEPAAEIDETDEFDFATTDDTADGGLPDPEFPDAGAETTDEPAAAEFSFESEPGDAVTEETATDAESFAAPPANAATLAAAADAFETASEFELADEVPDEFDEAACSMSLAEESSFEASWEEAYSTDSSKSEPEPASHTEDAEPAAADDPWFGGSETDTQVAEPAVLEFGAEPTTDSEHVAAEPNEALTPFAKSEPQPATQQSPGDTSVQAAAAPATRFVETFVVDQYSIIEEPLSNDIVWPKSAYFSAEVETPAAIEEALPTVAEAESFAEDRLVDATLEAEPQDETHSDDVSDQTSVFEFSATDDTVNDETDVAAESADPVAEETEADVEVAASDERDDTRVLPERQSLETMFEYGVDPHSETGIESDSAYETTFEQAELLLSEFGGFEIHNEVDAAADEAAVETSLEAEAQPEAECPTNAECSSEEAEPVAEPSELEAAVDAEPEEELAVAEHDSDFTLEIDPPQAIRTIDAMLAELSYDADDVGLAVNDRSDEPERPSIEIESELLRTVDHSIDTDRDIEDEIGATMLDICLDTQSAIYELTRQLRDSSASADVVEEQAEEELPHIADVDAAIFDVVEPETRLGNDHDEESTLEQRPQVTNASSPPKKRAFGSLFSDLRRRKQ